MYNTVHMSKSFEGIWFGDIWKTRLMIKLFMVQIIFSQILADFTSIGALGSARLAGRRSRLTEAFFHGDFRDFQSFIVPVTISPNQWDTRNKVTKVFSLVVMGTQRRKSTFQMHVVAKCEVLSDAKWGRLSPRIECQIKWHRCLGNLTWEWSGYVVPQTVSVPEGLATLNEKVGASFPFFGFCNFK